MAKDRNLDGNLDPHTPYQHSLQATTISPPIFSLSTIVFKNKLRDSNLALPCLHLSPAHPPPHTHMPQMEPTSALRSDSGGDASRHLPLNHYSSSRYARLMVPIK